MTGKLLIGLIAALGSLLIWYSIDGSSSETTHDAIGELAASPEMEEPAQRRPATPPEGLGGHPSGPNAADDMSMSRQTDQQPTGSMNVSDPGERTATLEPGTLREILVDRAFAHRPELMADIDRQFLSEDETRWGERSAVALDGMMSDAYAPNDPPPYSRLCRATICYLELDGSGEAALDLHGRLLRIAGSQYDFREEYGDFTFGFYSRLPDERTRFFFLHPDFRLSGSAESRQESAP